MEMTEDFKAMFSSKPTEPSSKQSTPPVTEKDLKLPVGALQHMSKLEKDYGLQSGILLSIAQQESGGEEDRANAKSKVGAKGWFQFMDKTAKQYDVNTADFYSSSTGAAKYLSSLKQTFEGDLDKMISAYNWGQGNVKRKGMENMPSETSNYLTKVKENLSKFGGLGFSKESMKPPTKDMSQNPKAGFPLFNMTQDFKELMGIQDM